MSINTVTLAEAANLIVASPTVRYLLEGEPGIGKSSIMSILERELPGHHSAYIDMGCLDLGDTGLPVPVHGDKLTTYYPNGRFKLHLNEPVILMLDEFGKAPRSVQNMLHPLLEARNPRCLLYTSPSPRDH
jgi:MoxR-like ATPase